jgi:hypothetical protein
MQAIAFGKTSGLTTSTELNPCCFNIYVDVINSLMAKRRTVCMGVGGIHKSRLILDFLVN